MVWRIKEVEMEAARGTGSDKSAIVAQGFQIS